jgi:hypothetical protein
MTPNRECQSALSVLSDHVPNGSRLVLACRAEPPLRIARLRAEGRVLELGPGDLSLTRTEAALLLAAAQVALGDGDVSMLHQRTEGWAAGLYLAALALRAGGPVGSAAAAFAGDDQLVSEYLEAEVLARISPLQRAFLTRTAALERMSGALVEAVLDVPAAAATLAELAQSNLLLVPLDRRGKWYRYHHLFRDMLLAELERLDPASRDLLPGPCRGSRALSGDLDGADAFFEEAIADRRRTARPAAPGHPPVIPRDRRRVVPVPEHRQSCSCPRTPSNRRPSRSTANSESPAAARPWPSPGSWPSWRGEPGRPRWPTGCLTRVLAGAGRSRARPLRAGSRPG